MLCAVYLRGIHVVCAGLDVTQYPEHQVTVELLDTRIIELHANNSLIQKSSYDIWIGPDAIQEESNCAQWSSTYLEAREIEFLST